ncbi:bifunctional 5,10-methylenetetrahydrofolate dehydrogenase/5,10-methenyltetrahydrofolate cyclohydrolase, partial [Patescibacteria group bacterium]|nr:bifunctional 5,10-methylenetetrahydrofolate dehydrogenase/5,10-methenyltetrahydrofolate cyclohydrolase [Patescibacteria group bacterium]MBU2263039.1 bifunctional 5,10-methylenetetrahydrofolate dehydrogenase/5,10-methenyltetrahydrofolate cyclohydrolase [Patescibacteria group bacterium]
MIIDGKKIAEEIKNSLKKGFEASGKKLKLAIVQIGEDPISRKFIERKIKFAEEIGVKTKVYNLPADITTNKLRKKMAEICHIKENSGVIIQLPLPQHINTQYILNSIPQKKDVDVLSENRNKCLTPVVAAIKEILDRNNIDIKNKNVVILGAGILVGKPAAIWFINQGATVSVLRSSTPNILKYTKEADIIVSGVGKPNLIIADMVKDGVIAIDAGGDIDPKVAEKSSLFTSILGGIGPITVAMVFKNLVELNK